MLQRPQRLVGLIFLTLALATPAFAKLTGIADPSCSQSNDPYETPTRIVEDTNRAPDFPHELQFIDQCVDSDRFRPAVILPSDSPNVIRFANYKHHNKYWIATLDKNQIEIEAIYFQIVMFEVVSGVTAAHTQFRVRFKKETPMPLVSNDGEEFTTTKDLVISYEASRPKDIPYNFALGAFENYLSVARVLSGWQRLDESRSNTTEQYALNLSAEEQMMMVEKALRQSDSEKFSRAYNTLIPNCTTEVFALIDALPSQQSVEADPFLTVLSTNPVAGPALKALKERGILGERYASLGQEIALGATFSPITPEIPTESQFFVNLEEFPYAVVLAANERANNPEVQQKAQKIAYEMIPEFLQKMGSTLMLGGSDASFSLLGTVASMGPVIKKKLVEVNDQLSDQPLQVSVMLVPWNGEGQPVDPMQELGIPIRLPFETYQADYSNMGSLNDAIGQVIRERSTHPQSFGLASVAMHLTLVKDNSDVKIQVLSHLGPLNQELPEPVDSAEALIERAVIPNYNMGQGATMVNMEPMALLELDQKYSEERPTFSVDFGPYAGFIKNADGEEQPGAFQLLQAESNWSCNSESYGTPRLEGWLGVPGAPWLGRPLSSYLHITHLDFDLVSAKVKKATVNVRPLVGVCLRDNADAGSQVTEAINEQIEQAKVSAAAEGGNAALSLFEMITNNNEEGRVSGFADEQQ